MKRLAIVIVLVLALLAALVVFWPRNVKAPDVTAVDLQRATFAIDNAMVTLSGGIYATSSAPGSASQTVTRYFGNEATGDINGDGIPDSAFIVTQSGGGSGTFYYVVILLGTRSGASVGQSFLLGDRIAPQTTEIRNDEVIVNYADRKPGEPMSAQPSVGVSKYFKVVNGKLAEVPAP